MATRSPVAPTATDFQACLDEPSRLVETRCGRVEVIERGTGPALLSVHGSPGNCWQGLLLAEFFRANGFRVVAPSRPGYGGTPLATGRSTAEQADAMLALLDSLGLERVPVVGLSGGGPVAYSLAGRHPDRVACLLQIDSIARPLPPSRRERLAFSVRPLLALQLWLVDHMPGRMLAMMGGTTPADPESAAAQQSLLRGVITSCDDWASMRAGYDNDEADFASLAPLPLDTITCPTLIVHGNADTTVPTSHGEHAHDAIVGSQMRWIPDGRHAAFWFTPQVQQGALSFLLDHHAD